MNKKNSYTGRHSSKRRELEVKLITVCMLAGLIISIVYGTLLPFRTSTLGTLLYDRGFTQIIVIGLAAIVTATIILKFLKLKEEHKAVNLFTDTWVIDYINMHEPEEAQRLRDGLEKHKSLIAKRCIKVLDTYIVSRSRRTTTEFVLDDSSFYQSASESSYSLPRILVWAIPLLGFIGTVIGISKAVSGFTGFLQDAGEIEQIKEGITTVTGGLAVAFDTTLLALLLSVLVMIPLVLIERYESSLLLKIDIFINDKIIAELKDLEEEEVITAKEVEQIIATLLNNYLPSSEDLVKPGETYAKIAVENLGLHLKETVIKANENSGRIINGILQTRKIDNEDRQQLINLFTEQRYINMALVEQIKRIILLLENNNDETPTLTQGVGHIDVVYLDAEDDSYNQSNTSNEVQYLNDLEQRFNQLDEY